MLDAAQLWLLGALALVAYLAGSLNTAIVACRVFGLVDPRRSGSNNPGATNLLRAHGWKLALPVLLADIGKASAVIAIARFSFDTDFAAFLVVPYLLGNRLPCFHGFRGGKGVAAAVGLFLALQPEAVLLGGGVFGAAVLLSRRVSVGSLTMVGSYALWSWLFGARWPVLAATGFCFVFLCLTHRANIGRLLRGEEPPIRVSRSKDSPKEGAP